MIENSLTSRIFGGIALPSKTAEDTSRADKLARHWFLLREQFMNP